MNANTKLTLEALEAREVPAVFGTPWQSATGLTMSFAPDGVQYSNQTLGYTNFPSRLFTELGGLTSAVWQEEVLRAVHTWTSKANLNVGLIADSGRAFGPAGFVVEGERPATFRLGTALGAADVIATAIPSHPLSGDYAGTIMLNEAESFSKGGASGTRDLYSVVLHEFGNALGLADDDVTSGSARNGHYSIRTGLVSADVNALRALYGDRLADAYEAANGNNSFVTASVLNTISDPAAAGKLRVVANGDLTTDADADFYKFTTPAGTTTFTVRLGTAGKSLLAGRVDVYNSTGTLLSSAVRTSPLQGDTVLSLTGLAANTTYTVKVSAGRADTFNIGKYQLRVGFGYDPTTETTTDPVQRFASDGSSNETRATATTLTTTSGFATNTHYEWAGRIESVADRDYYKFTAPATGVMTITVQSEGNLSTSATVYNSAGTVVASNVLINWEAGMFRAQIPGLTAGATYTVKLVVQDANWSAPTGNYSASIDFSQPLATNTTLTSGMATDSSEIAIGIDVQQSGAFRFNLSATSSDTEDLDWMDIYIYDANGNVVAMWGTDGRGSTDTLSIFLQKGKYTIQVVPYFDDCESSATMTFDLKLARLSDPIDPYAPPDPTSPPPPAPPPPTDPGVVIIVPPFNPWAP